MRKYISPELNIEEIMINIDIVSESFVDEKINGFNIKDLLEGGLGL